LPFTLFGFMLSRVPAHGEMSSLLCKPNKTGIMMPTVHKEDGYAVRIYTKDHPPPHVHVWRGSGVVKIQLDDGSGGLRVVASRGLSDREAIRAVRIVHAHRERLLDEWRRVHGEAREAGAV